MRMRTFWIAVGVALGLAVWRFGDTWQAKLHKALGQITVATAAEETTSSQTYLIEEDRWLCFEISKSAKTLRILTNANFSRGKHIDKIPQSPRPGWNYALSYELVDPSGKVVDRGEHHFRTQLTRYRDPETGKEITPTFYAESQLITSATCAMLYPMGRSSRKATQLRIRLYARNPAIQDIAVRVYGREERSGYWRPHLWQRISHRHKEVLCRASVWPPELLSNYEKLNLLRWQWRPLAPSGIEGRDYKRRILYTLRRAHGERINRTDIPAGLPVTPTLHGTIGLPANPGRVRLECAPIDPGGTSENDAQLAVAWFGTAPQQHATYQFTATRKEGVFHLNTEGGLLEIRSSRGVVVRAYWEPQETTEPPDPGTRPDEITPEPTYVRCFVADTRQPVEYEVSHLGDQPTPFRISLRRLLPNTPGATPPVNPNISWELLDRRNQVIGDGTFTVDPAASSYDRVDRAWWETRVTEPSHYYLALPAEVKRVRFRPLEGSVLLVAATRPPDLQKTTRVPDDYERSHLRDPEKHRSWFHLQPRGRSRLLKAQRTATLVVQPRPPEDRPEILAGRYIWEEYRPQGPWLARHLLVPREPDTPIRRQAIRATFCELETGVVHNLKLVRQLGRLTIRPTLIYQTEAESPHSIDLFVDGKPHDRLRLRGPRGSYTLSPIPPPSSGRVAVRIVASKPTRVFLNYVEPESRPTFLKRTANRFKETELSFEYEKRGIEEEVLSLRWFQTGTSQEPTRLRVKVLAPTNGPETPEHPETNQYLETPTSPTFTPWRETSTPLENWTLSDRAYVLRPAEKTPAMVLGTPDSWVDEGLACFLPLGSDIPPGKVEVRVVREEGNAGYLILSTTTPGTRESRDFFSEQQFSPES